MAIRINKNLDNKNINNKVMEFKGEEESMFQILIMALAKKKCTEKFCVKEFLIIFIINHLFE